jgi:hypothetical protein
MERLFALRQAGYANARVRVDARGVHPEAIAERIMEASVSSLD